MTMRYTVLDEMLSSLSSSSLYIRLDANTDNCVFSFFKENDAASAGKSLRWRFRFVSLLDVDAIFPVSWLVSCPANVMHCDEFRLFRLIDIIFTLSYAYDKNQHFFCNVAIFIKGIILF